MKSPVLFQYLVLILLLSLGAQGSEEGILFSSMPNADLQLEILVAGPQTSEASSMFGHLGLRMKYQSSDGQNRDLALSFVANTGEDSGIKQGAKGLIGLYNINLLIEPFEHYIKRTSQIENRTVERYILNSDHVIRDNLFRKLNGLKTEKVTLGKYYFFKKNCATTLYRFFSDIGYFINQNFDFMFPIPPVAFPRAVFHPVMLGLVKLPTIASLGDSLFKIEKKYGFNLLVEERKNNDISVLFASLRKMSIYELNILLAFDLSTIPGLRLSVLKELKYRNGSISIEGLEFLGYKQVSAVLYKLCSDLSCANLQVNEYASSFGLKATKTLNNFLSLEIRRSRELIFFSGLRETKQFQHAKLLEQAVQMFLMNTTDRKY